MSRGKRLSDFEKGKIQVLRSQNWSYRQISKKLKRSLCGKRGRKSTFSNTTKRHIFRLASNKAITARQIKCELGISQSVHRLQRLLASNETLIHLQLKKRPYMANDHIEKRLAWARNCMNTNITWRDIIWTEENKFNFDGPDGFQYYWYDLRKEPQYLSRRVHGGGSLMIWAGFSYNGKTQLAITKGSIDVEAYVSLLEEYLLPCCKKIGGKNWKLMHDNMRIHTSKYTKKWLDDLTKY